MNDNDETRPVTADEVIAFAREHGFPMTAWQEKAVRDLLSGEFTIGDIWKAPPRATAIPPHVRQWLEGCAWDAVPVIRDEMPGLPLDELTEAVNSCPCAGTGWLGREWLENREPACTCGEQTDDFEHTLHAIDCDAVPCPFCPLETL
jgi:hypothetical protein